MLDILFAVSTLKLKIPSVLTAAAQPVTVLAALYETEVTTFAATVGAVYDNTALVTTLDATVAAVTTLLFVVVVTVCVCAPDDLVLTTSPIVSSLVCAVVVKVTPDVPGVAAPVLVVVEASVKVLMNVACDLGVALTYVIVLSLFASPATETSVCVCGV